MTTATISNETPAQRTTRRIAADQHNYKDVREVKEFTNRVMVIFEPDGKKVEIIVRDISL